MLFDFLSYTIVGLVLAAALFISASGLVVTYSTTGVFNFAHGAIGMVAGFTFWELAYNPNHADMPILLAFLLVLFVEAPLLGLVIERVFMRRLHGASVERSLMVSLGLLLILLGVSQAIWTPNTTNPRVVSPFFGGTNLTFGPSGHSVVVTGQDLVTAAIAVFVAVGLWAFLRRVRIGVAMRAVVDDPELLAMAGAPPVRVQRMGWMFGSMLAAVAGMLIAGTQVQLDATTMTLLVVNGFAAAVAGRLRSLPFTMVGAIALGLLESYAVGYLPQWSWLQNANEALPMIFLTVVLLVLPQDRLRAAGRPVVALAPRVASLGRSLVGAGVVVALAVAAAFGLSGTSVTTVALGLVFALLALSLVVLTGYAGQVSLCQFSFLGIGAFAMGKIDGGGSWWGVLSAVAITAAVGAVVAIPTLRLRGLYVALFTLAFAQGVSYMFFYPEIDVKGHALVGRLGLFGFNLSTDREQLVLDGVAFAVCAVVVLALRRGVFGRRLIALSDSPAASATVGQNVRLTRIGVFALSGGMAGLAGALYGGLSGSLAAVDFEFLLSLILLLLLAIWGVRTVTGALLAGLSYALLTQAQTTTATGLEAKVLAQLPGLVAGVGIFLLGMAPNGVLGLAFGVDWAPLRRFRQTSQLSAIGVAGNRADVA